MVMMMMIVITMVVMMMIDDIYCHHHHCHQQPQQQQDNSSSEMVKLRAELEVFHYMYSPLLVLLQQASSSRSSSSSSTSSSMPPSSSSSLLMIDDEALEHCSRYTEQCLMKILEWQPLCYALKQEQLRMLQYQVDPPMLSLHTLITLTDVSFHVIQ